MLADMLAKSDLPPKEPAPETPSDYVHHPEVCSPHEYDMLIDDLFRDAVAKHPGEIALQGESLSMTYRELDQVTDNLAAFLRVQYSARPEAVVGIFMDRCEEYVIALLAALKAGAGYCPIELAYPGPLLNSVFEEASPCCVLTKQCFAGPIPVGQKQFSMDPGWERDVAGFEPSVLKQDRPTPESLMYVVYSGGSTGRPKGIAGPIRSPVSSYLWRYEISGYQPGARVGCNVFFVWEILRPLLRGGTVVVVPDSVIFNASDLSDFLHKYKVTEILFTPSLAETLLATIEDIASRVPTLQNCWLNGEVVTSRLLQLAQHKMPHVKLFTTYSVSECGEVAATELSYDPSRQFGPVGRIASFASYLLMDSSLNPVTEKYAQGELWVAGRGVGIGYLHNETVTNERFLFRDGVRYYRTGDLAREVKDSNGELEVLGRCDFMVKVRGYSVVLEAVESAITKRVGCSKCCVLAHGEEGTDKRLVAYLVPCQHSADVHGRLSEFEIDEYGRCTTLYEELLKELPHYAVPATFVLLPEGMPIIKSSMKIDRKKLPAPPAPPAPAVFPADAKWEGSVEQCVLLCSSVLGLPVGTLEPTGNFFAYGGHSLLLSKLVSKLQECGGPKIQTGAFMKAPTPEGLSELCKGESIVEKKLVHLPNEVDKAMAQFQAMTSGININVRSFWRYIVFTGNTSRVLLTGATGFVGAYLLKELLLKTECQIFCLVRASCMQDPEEQARERLLDNLRKYNIEFNEARVVVLAGDVSVSRLGLAEDDYMVLQQLIDVVIHSAAMVNLAYPYELLEAVNVLGTANVVHFAGIGKVKALHYVSTNGIFPEQGETQRFDEGSVPSHRQIDSGYGQTKWVAEQIVLKAQQLGLPGAIYRLGNVGGPRNASCWNSSDSNLMFMQQCFSTGSVPDQEWALEFTPVDFIAEFMVKCMLDVQHCNHKVFHLINRSHVSIKMLTRAATRLGLAVKTLPVAQWCEQLDTDSTAGMVLSSDALELLLGHHHDCAQNNVLDMLERAGIQYPLYELADLHETLRKLMAAGVLAQPRVQHGRLGGRVGIVTGASSGIGLATAKALAAEGMTVVMVSRSMEKLQRAAIEVPGAVCIPCDVTKRSAVEDCVTEAMQIGQRVDLLVNCAGVMYFTLMKNMHCDEWEQMIDINCKGVVNFSGAVLSHMLKAKTGHIVNISSDAAKTVFPALTVYNASKAFVNVFSKGLRAECVGTGLRVTDIQPGDTATNLIVANSDQEAAEKLGVGIGAEISGDRNSVLDPADVADAVVYAATAPAHVGIHEMLIEPRDQMFGDPTAMG